MKTRSGHLFKRGNVYYVQWRINGKLFMRSTKKTNKKDAEKERAKIMAPFLAGDEAAVLQNVAAAIQGRKAEIAAYEEERNPALAIDQAWTCYLSSPNRRDTAEVTLNDYSGYWKRFRKWLSVNQPAVTTLREVTERIASDYARDINGGKTSAGTFNKHRDFLKGFFDTLKREAKLTVNPWESVKRKTDIQKSRRELTLDELQRVCESAKGEMRTLFALGIYTGLRLGDCATLRWSEVDMQRGQIRRIPSKSARRKREPVKIPIHPDLHLTLASVDQTGEYVLPETAKLYESDRPRLSRAIQSHFTDNGIRTVKPGTGFKTVIDKDGKKRQAHTGKRAVVEVGFHSLRHTFVSLCREANAPLAVVESIVGHSNPAMTRHYTHIGEAAAGAAVAALPSVIGETPNTPEPKTAHMVEADPIKELVAKLNTRNVKEVKAELLALLP